MKKVLIISGSPRKGGNSDTLCDRFLDGAKEAGNEVEKIFLNDRHINYCTGCEPATPPIGVSRKTTWRKSLKRWLQPT